LRKKKVNIIFLIADSDFTGGPIQMLHLIENLDKRQFSFVVIAPSGFLIKKLKAGGIKSIEFDFKKRLFGVRKLNKIIKENLTNRDIIHCQGVKAGHFGRLANKKFKLPLIYTEHNWTKDYKLPQNWRAFFQLKMMKSMNKYTSHTVCVSQAVQNFLISKRIVTADDSSVIYNGVKFRDIKKREDEDPIVLGVIASLHKRKGLIYLFEAMSKLKNVRDKKIILKIVGAGPQEGFLKQHSVDLGINFDIQWLGVREDLTDFWSNINIYVQPSLDESFGMAVAEAMGYKIPVISTTAGALPEVVGDTGLLVEPGNSEELVKAIQNVINNKTIREENIERAYKKVKHYFSVDNMVAEYERLYLRVGGLVEEEEI